MTKEEAHSIYFGCEDIEECWEDRLFDHLNFFRTKVPAPTLFMNRIHKLQTDAKAAEILLGMTFEEKANLQLGVSLVKKREIRETFDSYYAVLNELRSKMYQSPGPKNLEGLALRIIDLTKEFSTYLSGLFELNSANELIGKEPDPMEVYEAIKKYESKGVRLFEQLDLSKDDALTKELKRYITMNNKFGSNV